MPKEKRAATAAAMATSLLVARLSTACLNKRGHARPVVHKCKGQGHKCDAGKGTVLMDACNQHDCTNTTADSSVSALTRGGDINLVGAFRLMMVMTTLTYMRAYLHVDVQSHLLHKNKLSMQTLRCPCHI